LSDKILNCADYLSYIYLGSRYPEEEIIELGRSESEKCVRCMEEILSILCSFTDLQGRGRTVQGLY
jgi:HEPN domain-containing protein